MLEVRKHDPDHRREAPQQRPRWATAATTVLMSLSGHRIFPGPTAKGRSAVARIGDPVRRYTVIPLEDPVSPTREPATPPPPQKSPEKAPPVTQPEAEPVR